MNIKAIVIAFAAGGFVAPAHGQVYTGQAEYENHAWFFPTVSDSLDPGVYVPGNSAIAEVTVLVRQDSNALEFEYTLTVDEFSPENLYRIAVPTSPAPRQVLLPTNASRADWDGEYLPWRNSTWWTNISGDSLAPGVTKSGFRIFAAALPRSCQLALSSWSGASWPVDGPGEVSALYESIRDTTGYRPVASVCPSDLPEPLIASAFADSIASYNLQAYSLGWTTDSDVYARTESDLHQARDYLLATDSVNAAIVLKRALRRTEEENGTSLSSESYALLKYNIEYLLGVLPDPATLMPSASAAITVRADLLNESIDPRFDGNSLLVDGRNHDVDGTLASNASDLPGIVAGSSYAYSELLGAVGSNQDDNIVGAGSAQPNIIQEELDLDVNPFVAAALESGNVVTVSGSVDQSLGSAEAPVVAYADSNIDITGNTAGYGLLIVDGDVKITGDASWTGLIIVRTRPDLVSGFTIQGDARVIGSVIISQTANLPARFFVRGNAQVLYSSEAVDLAAEAMGW